MKKDVATQLDKLIDQIRRGEPLDRSPETRELAERVAAAQKVDLKDEAEIREWARRLASKVVNGVR